MIYQQGGMSAQGQVANEQLQQLHQMMVQAGMIDPQQVSVEQLAQLPPEKLHQVAQEAQQLLQQQSQEPVQAQTGMYSDEESMGILGGINSSLMSADIDQNAIDSDRNEQSMRIASQKADRQQATGKAVANAASASAPAALDMLSGALATGEENMGTAKAVGSNIASRASQGASLGSIAGPWGTLVGTALGAGAGAIESGVNSSKYRQGLVDTQEADNVGTLGTSLNVAAYGGYNYNRGGYGSQANRERAYASSRANQSLSDVRTSNRLGLNAKIYAAGTQLNKSKMRNGGNSVWMEDQTVAKSYQQGGHMANMEAEGDEVVLGNMGQTSTYDGTNITNQSSAGGILKGPDHGQMNRGGSQGIPMDTNNGYIGSKRKTVDGKDISVKKGASAPSNSVAGKMKSILKDIEKIEKSNDRYVNNPVVVERKKQELAKLRDLAELGKMNNQVSKLIKKGNIEEAKAIMAEGLSQQQMGTENDMAMRNNQQYAAAGSYMPGYYAMGGRTYYQQGGMNRLGYQSNPNGTYQIDPSWDLEKQRKVAAWNKQQPGVGRPAITTSPEFPGTGFITDSQSRTLPTIDNRFETKYAGQPQQEISVNPTQQELYYSRFMKDTPQYQPEYNPYGQPILNTPTVITSGQGLSPEMRAAVNRPYGERRAMGGYYANGGFRNGQRVSFYANGGYHSGQVTNYNPSTGDFNLA